MHHCGDQMFKSNKLYTGLKRDKHLKKLKNLDFGFGSKIAPMWRPLCDFLKILTVGF